MDQTNPVASNDSLPQPTDQQNVEENGDDSIHAFNTTPANLTVIENVITTTGSDSGVEVIEPSDLKPDKFDNLSNARSCDSSIISCCSNYEEAYDLLVRRNSTLIEDYAALRTQGDGTSENGSESSSVTGVSTKHTSKRPQTANSKKRVSVQERTKERSRSKPPVSPSTVPSSVRLKSIDRLQGKCTRRSTPNSLDLKSTTKDTKKTGPVKTTTKTPSVTPTDDGRWPSVNSKPAPLMSRSLRGIIDTPKTPKSMDSNNANKTIEKYATLPRRRKNSSENIKTKAQRDESINRLHAAGKRKEAVTPLPLRVSAKKQKQKVKIYHETSVQTALTVDDVNKALAGVVVAPAQPNDVEKCDKCEQVDLDIKDVERWQSEINTLKETNVALEKENRAKLEKLMEMENRLREEMVEKDGLKEELRVNSQRVLAILGGEANDEVSSDSLMILESRFHNVSQVVIRQEEEISKLNSHCRHLQINLEKSIAAQKILVQQHQELEAESNELHDFIQAEKTTLSDALKEAENEISKLTETLRIKQSELVEAHDECKRLNKINEQRWQENLSLKARMGALESKSREILVHQGSGVSGTAVALSALINRLEGLVDELVTSYTISDQELEDVIYHNEAYSNSSSSPDATPEKARAKFHLMDKTPSPKKGSSFVSAVINAIKNAAGQGPFAHHKEISRENLCADMSSSNEMLDSETEPCLMMEHVLEDVIVPDGHSHNMISSNHSLLSSQSDSFLETRTSANHFNEMPSLCEIFPSFSLVDQVIDVDNLVTRLLKVIRIIQLENEDCMNELQEQRDRLSDQVDKQKETNKLVGKQLKDWEVLGARLKTEVKELMQQLCRKNNEIDNIKTELNKQREEVEKLNQDVCELSTALAKAELEIKMKEEEVGEAIKQWEKTGEEPSNEVLARLIINQNEVPILKEKLAEKERHLCELTQEFLASKEVLTESLQAAVSEAKKQYEAIDNALEVLHNNQNVVQQCPPLAELQRELENTSFQSALSMPLGTPADCNANAALLQARANLQIDTTA